MKRSTPDFEPDSSMLLMLHSNQELEQVLTNSFYYS